MTSFNALELPRPSTVNINRRAALATSLSFLQATCQPRAGSAASIEFRFRYALASCMYGYQSLDKIMPEARKIGAAGLDVWPKVHGNQREQIDEIGERRFAETLKLHELEFACITQYKLGPFSLENEMKFASRLGCKLIVAGGKGPKNLVGNELKAAIREFVEKLKPTIELSRATGVRLAIENHENNLIHDADSLKYLRDLAPADAIGIAFAPYHLPQDSEVLATLVRDLDDRINMFYAWQHRMGCKTKLPKEQELLQMPGRGDLDFGPIVAALAAINYRGWTEIFMHPVPRGIPILETTEAVTAEINRARSYLESQGTQR